METFAQILGWVGACLVVAAYILVSSGKVRGGSKMYQSMNLIGAMGVGINAFYQQAWPSLAIQVVWGVVALLTLAKGGPFKKNG